MKKLADDNTIRLNGIEALNRNLGPADALRFLSLIHREPTDYMEISRRLYKGETRGTDPRSRSEARRKQNRPRLMTTGGGKIGYNCRS